MSGARDLVVVADSHIGRDDAELPAFLAFLRERADDTAELVLLGDIFSLWLGEAHYTAPHHAAVLDACRDLRRAGVHVVFIEGNREFAAGRWRGDAFDVVGEEFSAPGWGGRDWFFAHGDLLNREDRAGRAFRHAVRSVPALALLRALPTRAGLGIAERIERGLRHRNLGQKRSIPRARFERYAEWFAGRGFDAGAIGHIHVEMRLEFPGPGGAPRTLFVLPDWRSTHRYLRVPRNEPARFEPWGAPIRVLPAVIEAEERDGALVLKLDAAPGLAAGSPVAVSSGHGPAVRRGEVVTVDPGDGRRITVHLEAGPPVQVGDRLVDGTGRPV